MDGIQILIFIVVALVYFIQWLARQGGNQNQNNPQSRGQGSSTEEEKVRRFMEALGMPTQDQPPPPPKKAESAPPPPPRQGRVEPQPLPKQATPPARQAPPERDYYAIDEKPEMAEVDAWGNKIKEMQRKAQEAEERFKSIQQSVAAKGGSTAGLGKAVGDFSEDEPVHEEGEKDAYAIIAEMEVGKASTLRRLMQTTAGAQQAVVLREVLGPPKGMEY